MKKSQPIFITALIASLILVFIPSLLSPLQVNPPPPPGGGGEYDVNPAEETGPLGLPACNGFFMFFGSGAIIGFMTRVYNRFNRIVGNTGDESSQNDDCLSNNTASAPASIAEL